MSMVASSSDSMARIMGVIPSLSFQKKKMKKRIYLVGDILDYIKKSS